jgi:hypothetical protein
MIIVSVTSGPTMTPDDLRAWRTRHGLNMARASMFFGVTEQTMYNWDRGLRPICCRARSLALVADQLGISRLVEIGAAPAAVFGGHNRRKFITETPIAA